MRLDMLYQICIAKDLIFSLWFDTIRYMKVEIINSKKQRFNGKNYWLDKSSGYYRNSSIKPHSLHRQVWIYHNGPILEGMTIDHIDRDKNNNQIENLRMVTYSENNKNVSKETQEKKIENANIQRPLTKAWHASPEGREWHRKHGIEAYKRRTPEKKICAHCGKVFETTACRDSARFCGQNCKMKARRRRMAGLPENEENMAMKKVCVVCGNGFYSHKKNAVTCSQKCRNKRTYLLRCH